MNIHSLVIFALLCITLVTCHELADQTLHKRKIILGNEVIDTERIANKRQTRVPVSDNKQRLYLVHVKENVSQKTKEHLEKEFGDHGEAYYIPHNTFAVISTPSQLEKAIERNQDLILWVDEMRAHHKLSEDLYNDLVQPQTHTDDVPQVTTTTTSDNVQLVDVLIIPKKNYTATQVAQEWSDALKADGLDAKAEAFSDRKILVSVTNKAQLHKVVDWLAKHHQSKHIQRREEFFLLQDELSDDPMLFADVDPLSDEYKTAVLSTASVLQKEGEREWIGQPGLPDVQFLWSKGLDGEGEVIGVGDTGIDYNHCAFHDPNGTVPFNKVDMNAHRKIVSYWTHADNKDVVNGHGTHVSSIAVANSKEHYMMDGVVRKAKISFIDVGMPNLALRLPADLSTDYFPLTYKTTPIMSNSWGNRRYGTYTIAAREIDEFSYKHRDFLALYAAGNSGRSGGSTITPPGTAKNALTTGAVQGTYRGFQMGLPLYADVLKDQMRRQMCSSSSFLYDTQSFCSMVGEDAPCSTSSVEICDAIKNVKDCCGHPFLKKFCCAKELLAKLKKNPSWFNPHNVAVFSSRGPTKDRRMKPELLAHGQPVFGARSDGTTDKYHCPIPIVMQGTSQATPVMASFALMARQYFKKGFYPSGKPNEKDGFVPSGALLKATLINSGSNMDGLVDLNGQDKWENLKPMPTFTQGFGRAQLTNSLVFDGVSNFTMFKEETEISTGDEHAYCFRVNHGAKKHFKSTLVWMDYPGSPSAAVSLVNNLDLRVVDETGSVLYGNGAIDYVNNAEQVDVPSVKASGHAYKVVVKGTKIPHGPQFYALVVTGQMKRIACDQVKFTEKQQEEQQTGKKEQPAKEQEEEVIQLIKRLLAANSALGDDE